MRVKSPPVASSGETGQDTIVYMASSFAAAIDTAVQNAQFSWDGIKFGTDISEAVTNSLQPSFVELLREQAKTGVWVHGDMVVDGYEAMDNGEIAQDQITTAKRGLDRVMTTHPFKGGQLAKQVLTGLIKKKAITIVGAGGAGIIMLLPDMQDIIKSIVQDGKTIAPLGEEINYDAIKIFIELADRVGELILEHMHQASLAFMWLLGPPDQISGPRAVEECPITTQYSELEEFSLLARYVLPGSIWNCRGKVFMEALTSLNRRSLVGILQVPKSKLGRVGLVVVRGDRSLKFSSTFGEEVDY